MSLKRTQILGMLTLQLFAQETINLSTNDNHKDNCFMPFNLRMASVKNERHAIYLKFQTEKADSPTYCKLLTAKAMIKTHYECCAVCRIRALDIHQQLNGACQTTARLSVALF
jgi:hypothetical protein